LNKAINLSKIS